ncbi:MAG: hypothetical protein HZA90_00920 [Verrucomicrobia bacterium]|nr:hypothetical protein [Verrucomicrobiota bacterium]
MPTSIESSRFEEFRNPQLGEALSACVAELKAYLPTPCAAILEKLGPATASCVCLAGEAPRKLRQIVNCDSRLRSGLKPGQALIIDKFAMLPISVFNSIDHVLAFDISEIGDKATIPVRSGVFASRISKAFESSRANHLFLRMESNTWWAQMMAHSIHSVCVRISKVNIGMLVARDAIEAGQRKKALEELDRITEELSVLGKGLRSALDRAEPSYRFGPIADIAARAEDFLRLSADARFIHFTYSLAPTAATQTVCFVADPIIRTLLRNSIEAFGEAKEKSKHPAITIQIHTGERPGCIHVSITDNGPGIAAEFQARMFEPGVTTKNDRLGMGLYVARKLAESMEGSLALLRSEPGNGATFRLTLPSKPTTA